MRPTAGAMDLHCVGMSFANRNSFWSPPWSILSSSRMDPTIVPSCLALLCRLSRQQRCDACPLILPYFMIEALRIHPRVLPHRPSHETNHLCSERERNKKIKTGEEGVYSDAEKHKARQRKTDRQTPWLLLLLLLSSCYLIDGTVFLGG